MIGLFNSCGACQIDRQGQQIDLMGDWRAVSRHYALSAVDAAQGRTGVSADTALIYPGPGYQSGNGVAHAIGLRPLGCRTQTVPQDKPDWRVIKHSAIYNAGFVG